MVDAENGTVVARRMVFIQGWFLTSLAVGRFRGSGLSMHDINAIHAVGNYKRWMCLRKIKRRNKKNKIEEICRRSHTNKRTYMGKYEMQKRGCIVALGIAVQKQLCPKKANDHKQAHRATRPRPIYP
jgi:hypothetical protein